MKKVLMTVMERKGKRYRAFATKYGVVRLLESDIENKSFSECYDIVAQQLGIDLESENASVEDRGSNRHLVKIGEIFEEDEKYFLQMNGNPPEEKEATDIAYWRFNAVEMDRTFPYVVF